ncbi:MAG: chemotaxis protein CheB [Sediminibacterium sp.]
MKKSRFDIIVIGGSAGSVPVLTGVLKELPPEFSIPVVIILHRMRNVSSEMAELLSLNNLYKQITEPEDKTAIRTGGIYLAPQNYHLLIEEDRTISLDYSDPVHFSRPSIDVSFECAAKVYKDKTLAVLLSGANRDGAAGLSSVIQEGGTGIVQSPDTAEYPAMPRAGIENHTGVHSFTPGGIVEYIRQL